jgi:hypothetical protein
MLSAGHGHRMLVVRDVDVSCDVASSSRLHNPSL